MPQSTQTQPQGFSGGMKFILVMLAVAIVLATYFGIRALGSTQVGTTIMSQSVLHEGLIGHWTFDGPDGLIDTSVSGNDATIAGTKVNFAAGRIGQGINFSHDFSRAIPHAATSSDVDDNDADTGNNVFQDVNFASISDATLTANGINDGDEVLLIVDWVVEGTTNNTVYGFRIADTGGTAVASTTIYRETGQTDTYNTMTRVMKRTTKVASEGFVLQKARLAASETSHVDKFNMTVISLENFIEGVDYVYNENNSTADLTTSTTTFATVTTPTGWNGNVLVMDSWIAEFDASNPSNRLFHELRQDTNTPINTTMLATEDPNDQLGGSSFYIFNQDSSAHNYDVRLSATDTSVDHYFSTIIAFRPGLFLDVQSVLNDASQDSVQNTWTEVAAINPFKPASTTEYMVMGQVVDESNTTTATNGRLRLQINGSSVPTTFTNETDEGVGQETEGDRWPLHVHSVESFSDDTTVDIDLDYNTAEASVTDQEYRNLVAFSLVQTSGGSTSSDSYIDLNDVNDVTTGDLSVSGWVYPKTAGVEQVLISKRNSTSTASDVGYILYLSTTSELFFEVSDGTDIYRLESNTTIPTNTWTHFTVVWDEDSAANTEIYLNGKDANATDVGTIGNVGDISNAVDLRFGVASNDARPFNGRLDDIYFHNVALTESNANRLYDLGGTTKVNKTLESQSALDGGITGHWNFDGQNVDLTQVTGEIRETSGNNRHGDWHDHASTTVPGRIGQGIEFDGTDDRVTTGVALSTYISASTASISAWIRPTGVSSADADVYDLAPAVIDESRYIGILVGNDTAGNTGDKLWAYNWDGNTDQAGIEYDKNRWTHAVLVHDGGTLSLYKDGKFASSTPSGDTELMTGGLSFGNVHINYFEGGLDDVRIYNKALTLDEIERLYKLGATTKVNKTIITQPTLKDGLVAHWTFDGPHLDYSSSTAEVLDISGNNYHGNWINASNTAVGRLGQAGRFHNDDYVEVQNITELNNATEATVIGWFKDNDHTANDRLYGQSIDDNNDFNSAVWGADGRMYFTVGNGSDTFARWNDYEATIPEGRWFHAAYVFDGGGSTDADKMKIYVNGVERSLLFFNSPMPTSLPNLSSSVFNIARDPYENTRLEGVVDDLRVYNRALSAGEIQELYNLAK